MFSSCFWQHYLNYYNSFWSGTNRKWNWKQSQRFSYDLKVIEPISVETALFTQGVCFSNSLNSLEIKKDIFYHLAPLKTWN